MSLCGCNHPTCPNPHATDNCDEDWREQARLLMEEAKRHHDALTVLDQQIRVVTCCSACNDNRHAECIYRTKPRAGCCCLLDYERRITAREWYEEHGESIDGPRSRP